MKQSPNIESVTYYNYKKSREPNVIVIKFWHIIAKFVFVKKASHVRINYQYHQLISPLEKVETDSSFYHIYML